MGPNFGTVNSKDKSASKARATQPRSSGAKPSLDLSNVAGNLAVQRALGGRIIQPKLTISQPDDPYKKEADRVADEVMRMPVGGTFDAELMFAPSAPQRKYQQCSKHEPEEIPHQPNYGPGGESKATRDLSSITRIRDSGGHRLPEPVQSFFEARFGQDFGDVRVHTGSDAAHSARAINARAFTVRNHLVFGADEYSPSTSDGQRLLAHELTHVVQQRGSLAPAAGREARQSPSSASLKLSTPSTKTVVQRQKRPPVGLGHLTPSETNPTSHYIVGGDFSATRKALTGLGYTLQLLARNPDQPFDKWTEYWKHPSTGDTVQWSVNRERDNAPSMVEGSSIALPAHDRARLVGLGSLIPGPDQASYSMLKGVKGLTRSLLTDLGYELKGIDRDHAEPYRKWTELWRHSETGAIVNWTVDRRGTGGVPRPESAEPIEEPPEEPYRTSSDVKAVADFVKSWLYTDLFGDRFKTIENEKDTAKCEELVKQWHQSAGALRRYLDSVKEFYLPDWEAELNDLEQSGGNEEEAIELFYQMDRIAGVVDEVDNDFDGEAPDRSMCENH